MTDFLYLSIFVGLLVNLVSVELVGVILGGFFVPGYLALIITDPPQVLFFVIIAMVTVALVRLMSNFMIIYGRKMLVLSILIGYLLNMIVVYFRYPSMSMGYQETFSHIIPGLMAYWMQRQGVAETLMLALTGAVITRLVLVVITGGAVQL
jgi:poly-gamma-glutamate biosynthesis protein PgsC/CapC